MGYRRKRKADKNNRFLRLFFFGQDNDRRRWKILEKLCKVSEFYGGLISRMYEIRRGGRKCEEAGGVSTREGSLYVEIEELKASKKK